MTAAGARDERRAAAGRIGPRAVMRSLALVIAMTAGLGASGVAHADVPTAGDFAACNREAREGRRAGAASPIAKDEAGAHAARQASAGTAAAPGDGRGMQSDDPQIHGMDTEGAKDAAYRAAYRVCMRKKGF